MGLQSIAMMTRPKLTLADIAKMTGVSTSTVSRALNDSPLINDETKQRIQAIARYHNYQIHLGARNFRLKRSFVVAVVIPIETSDAATLTNPFILEFIGSVGVELRNNGYDLLLIQDRRINERYVQSGLVDGFIQLGHGDYPILNSLPEGIPLAVWGPPFPGQKYCTVGIDNRALSRVAVEHLLKLGRRRIGLITTHDHNNVTTEANNRLQGYQEALRNAGLAIDPALIVSTDWNPPAGAEATRRLIEQAADVDAIFVSSGDAMALVVMETLRQLGRSMPSDVAIVGFDGSSVGETGALPLTTVSQEIRTTGARLLVQSLMQLIEGNKAPTQVIDGKLIVRRSCGAVT